MARIIAPRFQALLAAGVLAACLPVAGASVASASTGPQTVIQDDAVLLHSTDQGVKDAMARIRALGVDRVRLTAGWSVIAPTPDATTPPAGFDGSDPSAYPPGAWADLDRAVQDARDAGLSVDIDIAFWAPRWATVPDPSLPSRPGQLDTNIDPNAYAAFAGAVARRYRGDYAPPAPPVLPIPATAPANPTPVPAPSPDQNAMNQLLGVPATLLLPGAARRDDAPAAVPPSPADLPAPVRPPAPVAPLPAVDMFTIWNEPNHPGFLQPQWTHTAAGWTSASADVYRAMVMAAYPAIKAQAPGSTVLVGATSSMGSNRPGSGAVPPLLFLRQLACVDSRLRPIATGACANFTPLPGDGWSHHPYSLSTAPNAVPHHPDDVPVGATFRLTSLLRRLAASGRISPRDADVYMTEYAYNTNPPDPQAPFGLQAQARYLAWAQYIALRDPAVKMWPQFLLYDRPDEAAGPQMRLFGDWHSGLYFNNGQPKPAAATFRAPVFAGCISAHGHRYTMVWGRLLNADFGADAQIQAAPVSAASTASFHTQPSTAAPSPGASAAAAAAPVDGITTRYVPWRAHQLYRMTWSDPDLGTVTSTSVPALACSATKLRRPTRRGHHPTTAGGKR